MTKKKLMELWESILLAFGGSAALIEVLGFLARSFDSQVLAKGGAAEFAALTTGRNGGNLRGRTGNRTMLRRCAGILLLALPLIADARGGRSGAAGGLGLALVVVVCAGYLFSKKR